MEFEKFIEELRSLGLPPDPVIEFLKKLYTVRELSYEREAKFSPWSYQRPVDNLFKVDDWIIQLLDKYDLIVKGASATTRYGKIANVRYYVPTGNGLELGSGIFQRHLQDSIANLLDVLNRYSRKLIKTIALSAINIRDGTADWLTARINGWEFSTALFNATSYMESSIIGPDELLRLYKESKRAYGNLSSVFEKLREIRANMYEPGLYDIFMSKVLMNYKGRVHEEALSLIKELNSMGLAEKIPLYATTGEYIDDAYIIPPEISYVLDEYSADADLSNAGRMFLISEIITRALTETITKRNLTVLNKLGISEDEIKAALKITYEQGITSRYNEAGEPESPAFIILNNDAAKDETERSLRSIESIILTN